jgi:hypothetical protein
MSILRALNDAAESASRIRDFVAVARYVTASRGNAAAAAQMAERAGASATVASVLRAATAPGTLSDPTWASPISPYGQAISAFLGSLRSNGAFDHILPNTKQIPLRTRTGAVTIGIAAAIVGEGAPKSISSLALSSGTLEPAKATAIVAVTTELLLGAGEEGQALLERELRAGIATITDVQFIALVTAALTPIAASGTTVSAVWADLEAAMSAISVDAQSKLFWLMTSAIAKALCLKQSSAGELAFPGMSPQGGVIANVPALVTDGLASGTLVLLDANSIATNGGTITLDASREASLQMNSAPDAPPTAGTVARNLWQMGLVGLRAERFFGARGQMWCRQAHDRPFRGC